MRHPERAAALEWRLNRLTSEEYGDNALGQITVPPTSWNG